MTVDSDLGADRDDAFLQAGALGARAWRQRDVPHLARVIFHFHGPVRPGQADAGRHRADEFELFFTVAGPAVMRRNWKRCCDQCRRDYP